MGQRSELRKLNRILGQVKGYRERMAGLSDEELSGLTLVFRERLGQGETLEGILPEAYAAVCEADKRVLGMFPYDVQILGAIALHQGKLAEMNTGEGKTLVATMPLYLNALSGKSTILLTANAYLAMRDGEEMGQVYRFMGMRVGIGAERETSGHFTNAEKKEIYDADIVYTTHGALGFDYLLNNLVTAASERFLREFYYVIIDEADSVLLDAAQTPLVISGAPRVQSNLYGTADFFVTTLQEGRDYEKEDNKVWLTESGVEYAESFFQIENFYGEEFFEINRHVILALRAHALFAPEKQYMVSGEGELKLLDGGSGRLMPGVKLRGGQHQALEVKERLAPSQENRSVAAITFQNFFLLFPKMSGMSGTIADAAEELLDVYHVKSIVIPPNRPVRRKDLADLYFKEAKKQFAAAIIIAAEVHKKGQPVLIVVSSIRETEYVSERLMERGIAHNVLNANNAFWEAGIIKEAGQRDAVTVATSMAGRGTDIKLGEGVAELGGLAVIGIGRMANSRQERQARGRAGRQGDPGFSRFFLSLEDEVVAENTTSNLRKCIGGEKHLGKRKLERLINGAQKMGEEYAVQARRQAMNYDEVIRMQRELMYAVRDELLDGGGMDYDRIGEIVGRNIRQFLKGVHGRQFLDMSGLRRYILDNISYRLDGEMEDIDLKVSGAVEAYLMGRVQQGLKEQEKRLGTRKRMNDFIRVAVLKAIDEAWVEQVDYLQQIQAAVSGRASAQRNVLFEFQKEALEAFRKMEEMISRNIMRNVLLSNVYIDGERKLHIVLP
ncbi:MAG: accessory Sec system translocase SecA2 [Lachnospiraceae bacterium]|jgi:preprotein translocase subunit SecA|nr:accessory Sec system translocase SecA2 [Lachnospiraceae bacterium]